MSNWIRAIVQRPTKKDGKGLGDKVQVSYLARDGYTVSALKWDHGYVQQPERDTYWKELDDPYFPEWNDNPSQADCANGPIECEVSGDGQHWFGGRKLVAAFNGQYAVIEERGDAEGVYDVTVEWGFCRIPFSKSVKQGSTPNHDL